LVASNGRNLYTTGKRAKIVFLTVQIHCPEKIHSAKNPLEPTVKEHMERITLTPSLTLSGN